MDLRTARIFVNDIQTARGFYAETLGLPLKVDRANDGYCVFNVGSVDLVLESVPENAPPEDQVLVGRFTGLSFTVQDVVSKHQELQARGVPFIEPPECQAWGGILATFHDPAGNALQLVQLPALT